jgi:tRNA(Ser,Leu) C12 N-acetylase TAN1
MEFWNVVVTVHEGYYQKACAILEKIGSVSKTEYFNVLVMQEPQAHDAIARFVPVTQTFFFTSAKEFEIKAKKAALSLTDELHGKKFFVRMHRRGFKKRISSMESETLLDKVLLDALAKMGTPGTISFSDPEAVITLETVGQLGGLALFTREELARYPFLHLD